MTFKIEMPHVGESVTEAVIEKWLKQPGDHIEKYEPIVEVVTDKVAMEVPAPATGELTSIVAQEGETVAMGAVIAEMDAEGAEEAAEGASSEDMSSDQGLGVDTTASSPESIQQPQQPSSSPKREREPSRPSGLRLAKASHVGSMITGANVGPTGGAFSDTSLGARNGDGEAKESSRPSASGEKTFARLSPAVRRLLDEHGLDAAAVAGTGVGGRITRADVLKAAEGQGAASEIAQGDDAAATSPGKLTKPSTMRRMIAEHMAKSFREIPHAWSAIEVDVSGMVECRSANQESATERTGTRLTYLPFTLAVVAGALRSNPLLNSSWQQDGILQFDEINVGIAVAGKGGLVVPVVKNADQKSVLGLSSELAGLVDRAREGKLALEEVSGGTFTLNNTGALGSVWGGAIINHPQAAILTTEAIVKRPVVVHDAVQVRPMVNICLSFDHRVIDGAEASAFLQDVKSGLEAISTDTALE